MAVSKVAVVVGIGPGTGASVARKFALEDFKVALVSRRLETLQPVEQAIKAAGGEALSVPADTGKMEDVRAAHAKICSALGAPSVLVYNAGPGLSWPPPGILDIDPDNFAHAFDSGVSGALYWAQQVLPAMVKARQGSIMFTGATAALRGSAKFALLACPKFALRALAQSMAREFQPQGIHVAHVIIDGGIRAPGIEKKMPGREMDSFISPDAIAEAFWQLHCQDKSALTHEMDLRPASEKF